jgi:hypothetical protein
MELYSEIGRKALQFFYENAKKIEMAGGTNTIIYYEQSEDKNNGEFLFWDSQEEFDEDSTPIFIELKNMENPSMYLLMDSFFDHVSI